MATVELRPGDVLNIVWSSVQNTPLGRKEVESSFSYSYDDLPVQLKARGRRNSGTEGVSFRRLVALTVNAIKKGTWSTGARIDRDVVYGKMIQRLANSTAASMSTSCPTPRSRSPEARDIVGRLEEPSRIVGRIMHYGYQGGSTVAGRVLGIYDSGYWEMLNYTRLETGLEQVVEPYLFLIHDDDMTGTKAGG